MIMENHFTQKYCYLFFLSIVFFLEKGSSEKIYHPHSQKKLRDFLTNMATFSGIVFSFGQKSGNFGPRSCIFETSSQPAGAAKNGTFLELR